MGRLFGTDGIRGVANRYPMTAETVLRIGRATASFFRRKGNDSRIIVGKDTRISGYMIESALISGICSMGVSIIQVGPIPTPGVAFLTKRLNADALNHTLQTEWARDNISNKRFAKVPPVFYTPVGTL